MELDIDILINQPEQIKEVLSAPKPIKKIKPKELPIKEIVKPEPISPNYKPEPIALPKQNNNISPPPLKRQLKAIVLN